MCCFYNFYIALSSVHSLSHVQLFVTPWKEHARTLCPSQTPRACSNSCPLSQWCHPAISSSVISFSCLQSFPASGSFPRSQLFASGGQSIGASASVLEYSGLISFRIDWFDLLAVQGSLQSLLQHHNSKLLRTIASHYRDAQPNSPATQKEQQPRLAGQSPRLAGPEPRWNLQGILSSLAWLFLLWWASFKDCHLLQTIDFSSIFKYSKTPDLSFPIQTSAVSPCYSFFSHPVMTAHRAPIWHKRLDWWQPKKLDKV